ncbi:unnamed protein product [Peronospora belbahrii]|uniref:Uncharacterized protein n=1 Tax=Peronospora belbahrii TaxID=622444 RepID=A0AAU9KTW9_9STRA|nr:unnamed protein product [Peronospora belbahrii]CAH0518783.1 unnamed protein product [Peronospora belbahrii]
MFKSLFRCIRRFFSRIKPKPSDPLQRSTDYGANIDIEEALAEELEIQRRSGRVLSSTASIAAALRNRPRGIIPVFSTRPGNVEHRGPSDPATKTAMEGMQSLTPGYSGRASNNSESRVSAKSPAVSDGGVPSNRLWSSHSSFKNPLSMSKVAKPDEERETKETTSLSTERLSEMNPRRSSIFDMRSEWI